MEEEMKNTSESERYKALADEVAKLAKQDIAPADLAAIRAIFCKKNEFRIGDFKAIYAAQLKKVLMTRKVEEETKAREKIDASLVHQNNFYAFSYAPVVF